MASSDQRGASLAVTRRNGARTNCLAQHRRLGATAWEIADRFGLAKTYDAEYLALGRLLDCRVVTLDGRLRRGTAALGYVVGPDEL